MAEGVNMVVFKIYRGMAKQFTLLFLFTSLCTSILPAQTEQRDSFEASLSVQRINNVWTATGTFRKLTSGADTLDYQLILTARSDEGVIRNVVRKGTIYWTGAQDTMLSIAPSDPVLLPWRLDDHIIGVLALLKKNKLVLRKTWNSLEGSRNRPGAPGSTIGLEINGVVLDDTKTKTGRDFFDQFYKAWNAHPVDTWPDHTIVIAELPTFGRTTAISVKLNGEELLQQNLFPNEDFLSELTRYTINLCIQSLGQKLPASEWDGDL
jgi:hypothetical protein